MPQISKAVCVCVALLSACGSAAPAASTAANAEHPAERPTASAVAPTRPAATPARPNAWATPEVLVAASSFHGVHGVAVDKQGRLLAGSVVGHDMWEVDRQTGAAKVFIPAPLGEADDIAIGPKGELAWTSYAQGIVRYRERDDAPIRELAKGLPGINSIAFNLKTGKLYASQVFLGDALWEIDVRGKRPPRSIGKELGGFNGFEVGPDGQLYGPLWFKNQVVKIDPANGKVTVINAEFATPAAANLDGKGNLWVLDTKLGTLNKVELANGKKAEVVKLATSLDNLVIAPDGTIYVSNMADNSIQAFDPSTGKVTTLTRGKLSSPGAIKLDHGALLVADVFAFRSVDVESGDVHDIYRAHDSKLAYPGAIGLGSSLIALSSWSTGSVQLLDRADKRDVEMLLDFKAPMDAIPLDDGSLLVAELGSGSITRASGAHYADRSAFVKDVLPTQMILGKDRALYITEVSGRLTKVDLASGAKSAVAEGLAMPEGIAETPWGTFVVAEAAAQRLTEIDPRDGSKRTVAEGLPIGLTPGFAGMPPPYIATGVAVGDDGTVFMSADLNQSLLRIRPQ